MLVNLLYKSTKPETNSTTPLSPDTSPSMPILGSSKLDYSWTGEEELDHAVLELVGVNFLIELYLPLFELDHASELIRKPDIPRHGAKRREIACLWY
jgi:hypothetical protein